MDVFRMKSIKPKVGSTNGSIAHLAGCANIMSVIGLGHFTDFYGAISIWAF